MNVFLIIFLSFIIPAVVGGLIGGIVNLLSGTYGGDSFWGSFLFGFIMYGMGIGLFFGGILSLGLLCEDKEIYFGSGETAHYGYIVEGKYRYDKEWLTYDAEKDIYYLVKPVKGKGYATVNLGSRGEALDFISLLQYEQTTYRGIIGGMPVRTDTYGHQWQVQKKSVCLWSQNKTWYNSEMGRFYLSKRKLKSYRECLLKGKTK